MKKQHLLVLLLIIFLSACKNSESLDINPPRFLRVVQQQITWESIDSADYYVLNINGIDQVVDENIYELSNLEIGIHLFKIKVVIDNKESTYSNEIEVKWIYSAPISNIRIDGNTVVWDQITGDDNYHVEISGKETQIEFDSTTSLIDFSEYEDEIYNIKVNLNFGDDFISENEFIVDLNPYTYFDEMQDFIVSDVQSPSSVYFNGDELSNNLYMYELGFLTITKEFLLEQSLGKHQIKIDGEIPYYFTINIIKVNKPHIVSSAEIDYNGEDIVVLFEVYEGQISSINGYQINNSDYSIQDNQLTIFHEYIDLLKGNEPNRTTLVITYTLINGPYTVYGAIIINL